MDKKALRAEIRAKKRALTEEQIVRYSEELAQKLFAHPLYQAAKSIYGYMSYNQEVRTMPILRQAQADGKRVAVPKSQPAEASSPAFEVAKRASPSQRQELRSTGSK